MMYRKLFIPIISFLLSAVFLPLAGQKEIFKPETHGEQVRLFTDRPFYVVSERLYFTVFYEKPENAPGDWSKVIYVELLRWDGSRLAQTLAPIQDGRASGSMELPLSVNSGTYYLRAYTRWMRNYSPYSFTYLPVSIMNPRTDLIDKGPENGEQAGTLFRRIACRNLEGVSANGLQERYNKGEEVNTALSFPEAVDGGTFSVSITKDTPDGDLCQLSGDAKPASRETVEFLPEITSPILSGKVINSNNRKPVSGISVNLSSFPRSYYFLSTTTDENGDFYFTLPNIDGEHEFHLATAGTEGEKTDILITNEFCNKPVILPYIPFHMEPAVTGLANELSFNAQISSRYAVPEEETTGPSPAAFYGTPVTTIFVKDYIELNDLREFFYELVYNVSIGYTDRVADHLVVNAQGTFGSYPPLILMDNIPVANDIKLIQTPSRRVERIDVINKGYVLGDYKYSGIISIYSRNKDMAGMEADMDNHFFNYRLFDTAEALPPVLSDSDSRIPDRRNLLYFDPDVQAKGEPVQISFRIPEASGSYVMRIQGIDEKGEPLIWEKRFRVE